MSQTTCGNLTSVFASRNRPARRFFGKAPWAALFGAFLLAAGCESDANPPASTGSKASPAAADPGPAPPKPMTEDEFAQRTEQWSTQVTEDPTLAQGPKFFEAKADLVRVSNEAKDVHLRANASLLLGLLYEQRKDVKAAIAQYGHAAKLVPGDAGPHMALALALASDAQYAEAVEAQKEATKLDPDNLENWLVLGELLVKAGDEKAATSAYIDYERRRKGLIDGLTLKNKQGAYMVSTDERVGCAEALASATDQGTAIALTYALKTDPEADVQATVASVMGIQRLAVYQPALTAALPKAQGEVEEAIAWALSEIDRDPVKPTRPELPDAVLEAADDPAPAEPSEADEATSAKP